MTVKMDARRNTSQPNPCSCSPRHPLLPHEASTEALPCPMDDTCRGALVLCTPRRFALTSPKTASGPQRIFLVF